MPWNQVTPMEEIIRFVMLARSDRFTLTDLCEQFGVSRKTGYKHLARYADAGLKGLQARSHRAHRCPHRTDTEVEALILTERRLHRTWGPKKLRVVLETKHGLEAAPVCSTIAGMLRRHGLSPLPPAPSRGLSGAQRQPHPADAAEPGLDDRLQRLV